jgi:hypothetical protein
MVPSPALPEIREGADCGKKWIHALLIFKLWSHGMPLNIIFGS